MIFSSLCGIGQQSSSLDTMLSPSLGGAGTGYLLQEREIHPVLDAPRNHAVEKGLCGLLLFFLAWTYEHRQRCDESALSPADLSVACLYLVVHTKVERVST